jgi:hypothetical protein
MSSTVFQLIRCRPPLPIGGQRATCGAHFVGWSGGGSHEPNGWAPLPGDEKRVTEATVVWPASTAANLGCGEGVAKLIAFFTTKHGAPACFVGCLHDLPAGSIIPPKIWGTFYTLKSKWIRTTEDNQAPE